MSVRMSAWNVSTPTGRVFIKFEIWVFSENVWRTFTLHKNRTRLTGALHEDQYIFLIISHLVLLRMAKLYSKITTHILCSISFFIRSCHLWDNVKKYCRAGEAKDISTAHAHYSLDTRSYKHTLRICNTHFFSTATIFARTRLSISLYVHWLTC